MKKENWIWMPHPAHFICSSNCKFFLSTYVGKYIVSTVGELFHDEGVREIIAQQRNIILEGIGDARKADYMNKIGFDAIGSDRRYETMVFKAIKSKRSCCPYRIVSTELDFLPYNEAEDAFKGHYKLCKKWMNR